MDDIQDDPAENAPEEQPVKSKSRGKPKMRFEEIKISPAQAREWLARPSPMPRRTIRQRNVAKLLHAIENNDWKITHQGIALAPEGYVIDGHHRLTAIASQRKHVPMVVTFDADPETYLVADTGAARSPGDVLKIAGYTDVNVLSATTRQVIAYPEIVGTSSTLGSVTNRLTNIDIKSALDDPDLGKTVEESIRPAALIASGVGRYGTRTSATVLVAVISLYSEYGADTQEEFFLRLGDGLHMDAASPIYALRQWVLSPKGYADISGTYRPTAFLALGIRAWNDYAEGNERHSIRYRGGKDIMPEVS